jgi:hypothetical protein
MRRCWDSEHLYDDINASEGRSNVDIEKHLRRSAVKAVHAQVWLESLAAKATAMATQAPEAAVCPVGSAYG